MSRYRTGNRKFDALMEMQFKADPEQPTRLERIIAANEQGEFKRGHKFNVSATEYRTANDGTVFDSKRELYRYDYLHKLLLAGEITNLEMQVQYVLQDGFEHQQYGKIRTISYLADFRYLNVSYRKDYPEQICVEDAKGFKTEAYKIKRKLFLQQYPKILFFEV